MSTVLEVSGLSVEIDVPTGVLHAADDVSFSVDRGETLCIVGESGCGKTITALAIMGLLPRNARRVSGRLVLEGANLPDLGNQDLAALRGERMGMIFQDPMTSLNPVFTIGEQLEEVYLRHRKAGRKEARERAVYLLERSGVPAAASRLGQYPHQLSGGLRQRVMIAMTLMCNPTLIIADEPTTALDVTIQAQILHLLADLQREVQMALILVTHDLGIVARIADRVAVMYAGRIVETGTRAEIFSTPVHPYTQGLLRCIPAPGRTRRGSPLGAIGGMVPSPIGPAIGCLFRNRCRYARNACAPNEITLAEISPGRACRCVLDPEESRRNFEAQ